MHRQFKVSPEEGRRAKWPHEIFLINLIFNHIFLFCATVAVFGTFPLLTAIVPTTSFAIVGYIFFRARQVAVGQESWFIKAHWKICAARNKLFMLLLTVACLVSGGGLWLSNIFGWAKVPTIALIAGVGLLPFMVSLLVLIVLGNESVFMARDGKLPKRFTGQDTAVSEQQSADSPK